MNTLPFYVTKTSGTSADSLLTIGFASMLRKILEALHKESKGILIRDAGSYYEISLPIFISDHDLQQLPPFPLVQPLVTSKQIAKQNKQGKTLDGFPYEDQQQRSKAYREKLKQLPPELQRPEARLNKDPQLEEIADLKPRPELAHYSVISQMKVVDSFNDLALRWDGLTAEQRRLHIQLLLTLFSSPDNNVSSAIAEWQKLAKEHQISAKVESTALQIINPTTGKGANRAKASELAIGNQNAFWLLELLKFEGFMHAAAPFIIQGSKDRKTYVLQPQKIELSTLQGIMREFREVCWSSTAIKLDLMASLRFAQVFAQYRKVSLQNNVEVDPWDEPQVISVAQGFEVGFYKDMGSAYATMNVAAINLPEWLPPITDQASADDALQLLEEHIRIIRGIRNSKGEEGSEEFELLRFYRDFLSGRTLRPLWKFTTAYSGYLISQHEREKNPKRQIRQLTTTGLETLIMNSKNGETKLAEITSNEGFKHIAYAIRQSTVIAQYRRAQANDRTYEVRYGLGQELMREARYREKFMTALCEFLQQYNAETAREEEKVANRLRRKLTTADRRANNLRASIAYTDIDEVAELIDRFRSSELICSMLVAYGYAREPRKSTASESTDVLPPDDIQEETDEPASSEE
ncbi:MAG TPA: hypothetical protein VF043_14465 [Ktedonobacteraceae bacterium]